MLRQKSILDMFARSPIRPLQCHMKKVQECVTLLMPFYYAVQHLEWQQGSELYQQIYNLEYEADVLKCDLRLHLPNGLFLPVSRSDLLTLLNIQDSIANCAKDIAGIMLGRKMHIPDSLAEAFANYLMRCIAASQQAQDAISELDELLESGFRGKEVQLVAAMIRKLNTTEQETDRMQIDLRQGLFDLEADMQPVAVIFLYKVFEWVGQLANGAQQAGYQLQLLLAD